MGLLMRCCRELEVCSTLERRGGRTGELEFRIGVDYLTIPGPLKLAAESREAWSVLNLDNLKNFGLDNSARFKR